MCTRRWICAVSFLCGLSTHLFAQSQTAEYFVVGRLGSNLAGNTYLVRQVKPVAGAGVSAGLFLSRFWAAEAEVWVRRGALNRLDGGSEQLYSLSAQRIYAETGMQPYLAGGIALLRSREGESDRRARMRLQVQVTAGVRLPIARRFSIDLDLRGNGGGSTMIVRPAVGLACFF